jgi:hypothetical protein
VSLWDAYTKFLDRRLMRYGADAVRGYQGDAIQDAQRASVFDFTSNSVAPDGSYAPASASSIHGVGTLLHPDLFFLPFETCAAEFIVPDGAPLVQLGRAGGRIVVLVSRPEGHDVGFGYGEHSWDVQVITQLGGAPVLRICHLSMSGQPLPVLPGEARVDWDGPAAPVPSQAVDSRLHSCCEYVIGTGRCLSSWNDETPPDREDYETKRAATSHFAAWGMARIEEANSPANWVVRVTDEHARVVKRGGKTTREKRTRLLVIPDRDLDRVLRIPNEGGDHIEKAPHRRRAHPRRLTSPRFRLKRGQTVHVKESWIGPKEASYGGERYQVLTSLPSSGAEDVEVQA